MSQGQPEKELGPSKRRRRSRSRSMTQTEEVIDLTESMSQSAELEISSSSKHDRHEEDPQDESPNKRTKLHRNSEPPKRKDTSTTPRRRQKKSGKKINLHKVSRTGNYSELKAMVKTLERELKDAEQAGKITDQALNITKQALKQSNQELKHIRKVCDGKSEEVRALQSLKALVDDPVHGVQAFQEYRRRKDKELKAKDGIIASQQEELYQAKKEREQAVQENEAARTLNDSNGARNEQVRKRELTAKDKLSEERKEHIKTVSGLTQDKFDLQQQYKHLNSHLKARENKFSEMIARLQLQLQQSGPQSQRYNFKVSDSKVKQDFVDLESKIRHFVDKYTRPILNVTDQDLENVWPSWSPELRKFLTTPLLCHLAFEGYIWECLLARIFTPWSKVWAGDLGRPLEKALRIAGAEAENAGFESEPYVDYQYWRSNSSSFIKNNLNGGDFRPKYFDSDVATLVSNLMKLCGLTEVTDTMKDDAMGIFKDARDFEIQLRMLKAVYTFHMCKLVPGGKTLKYGVYFDNEAMVDRSPYPSDKKHGRVPAVDFIMSPGLHKRGNNDGDMYQDDTWLVRMGVVCDSSRFFLNSDRSNTAPPISVQTRKALESGKVKQEGEGQDIALQRQTNDTANESSLGTPISDPPHIKAEETYSQQYVHPLSISGHSSGNAAPEARDAAQTQSGTTMNVRTRSQGPPKADSSAHDGVCSTKSEN